MSWNDVEAPAVQGTGVDLGSLIGPAAKLWQMLNPPPPNPLDVLRARLLMVELQKALGGVVAYGLAEWDLIRPRQRSDHVIVGQRGSGKTALGVRLAEDLAGELELPVVAVGMPRWAAERFGFQVGKLDAARDAVVLIDEAGIRLREAAIWDALALARHRNVSVIYTTQSTAALPRDALRLEVDVWAKQLDPLASRFEREELVDLWSAMVTIQGAAGFAQSKAATLRMTGSPLVTASPLPTVWSEELSVMHRR